MMYGHYVLEKCSYTATKHAWLSERSYWVLFVIKTEALDVLRYVTSLDNGGASCLIESTREGNLSISFPPLNVTSPPNQKLRFNVYESIPPLGKLHHPSHGVVPSLLYAKVNTKLPDLVVPSWEDWRINCPISRISIAGYISSKYATVSSTDITRTEQTTTNHSFTQRQRNLYIKITLVADKIWSLYRDCLYRLNNIEIGSIWRHKFAV